MNVAKWTIGLALIALSASPVLAQTAVQTAFNYQLTSCCEEPSCACDEPSCCCDEPSCCCDEPSCCCDEPSCCCDEPSCGCDNGCCGDGCCGDACCGDSCGCGSACGGGGCLLASGWNMPCGDCNLGSAFTLQDYLGCDTPFSFGGWMSFGYDSNNIPLSVDDNDGFSFGDNPEQFNLEQWYMYAERVADGSKGLDWGFRGDIVYGTDAQQTQAFGNDDARWDNSDGFDRGDYGWALPQAYLEIASGDLSVIGGHFYTLVGYEVVTDPDNFFATNPLTFFNSEPFTHTGVLATYSGFDGLDIYAGWTLGWDTGFDQANGGSSWLGGFSAQLTDDIAFTYISTAGNFGLRGSNFGELPSGTSNSGYSHSLVFDVTLTDNLNYVFQSDLVSIGNGAGVIGNDDQVGINQYLFYTHTDCLASGIRAEWWKSDGFSYGEVTLGLNYQAHANVAIRPGVRWDFATSDAGAQNFGFIDEADYDRTTFSIDGVFTY